MKGPRNDRLRIISFTPNTRAKRSSRGVTADQMQLFSVQLFNGIHWREQARFTKKKWAHRFINIWKYGHGPESAGVYAEQMVQYDR
jgi:hypothetical protein